MTDDKPQLSEEDIASLREAHLQQRSDLVSNPDTRAEYRRLGAEMYDDEMTSIGYVALGYDGRVVTHLGGCQIILWDFGEEFGPTEAYYSADT